MAPVRIFFGQGGYCDAGVRTFWCKEIEFFEIYGVSAWTRDLIQFGHFADKGKGG